MFAEHEPSRRALRRLDAALAAHRDYEDFGVLPESGGTREQPAVWHRWIRVVGRAIRAAEEERG